MLLTTVKLARDCERRFCFELIAPTSDTLLLQAENDNILNHWVSVLQNATANALNNSSANPLKRTENNNDSEFLESVRLCPGNLVCADCGTAGSFLFFPFLSFLCPLPAVSPLLPLLFLSLSSACWPAHQRSNAKCGEEMFHGLHWPRYQRPFFLLSQ